MPHFSLFTSHLSPRPAAWLHNSELSLWLSVDPLSDKYPGVSPYVYCGNNPVRLVDADGRDWWEVNKSGYIQHVEGSEGKPDELFAVKGHGAKHFGKITDKTASMQVDADILTQIVDKQTEVIETDKVNMQVIVADKRSEMISLFEFLADNTNVEWVLASFSLPTGKGMGAKEPRDFLVTDHHQTGVGELQFSINLSKEMECFRHSHPRYHSLETLLEPSLLNVASRNDIKHMQACQKAGATCPFILRANCKNIRYGE